MSSTYNFGTSDSDWQTAVTVPDDYYDMADKSDSRHIFGDF